MKQSYELMTIAEQNLGEEGAKKLSAEIQEIVTSLGGSIMETKYWGKRGLAYPIGSDTEGYYDVLTFELDSANVEQLKSRLNMTDGLVRYLITLSNQAEEKE